MNIQLAPQDYYYEIQQAAENKMSKISLQDILDSYPVHNKTATTPKQRICLYFW